MKIFLDCQNAPAAVRLINFNEFLFTKILIVSHKKCAASPAYNLIWKKSFMGWNRCLNSVNYFNSLKPMKFKILIFFKSVVWNKTYLFYSNFNQTNFFNLSFYFLNKILYFAYFFNKIRSLCGLFLILNFKSFYFLRNNLDKSRANLILLNSKFI